MSGQSPTFDGHAARLLLLLLAFRADRKALKGLTKLAKLDFLLRYPVFLERLLEADSIDWPENAAPTDAERLEVEEPMIRYKYGPWDQAYYPILGSLISRGLVKMSSSQRTRTFALTESGKAAAEALAQIDAWGLTAARSTVLSDHFDLTGNRLKDRIYEELHEAVDRPMWEQIR